MSAKKPNTPHSKALSALQNRWITKREYRMCCKYKAYVSGAALWVSNAGGQDGWHYIWFRSRGKVSQ